ncbi:uncharacterized protein LOC127721941 [Mytilus californianus]|uniref:uncharacterized protein LOC127721941 n=1 Tax=Mytilus californianus TaxID=6549 RepID=UPI0022462F15|nr:uncharacterized protein LOC127721941 [Mytilus californianus]
MHSKHSVLFVVIQFTEIIYSLNMEDVCSAEDDTCKKPNLSGVGEIEKGKCSLAGVLLRFRQLSLLECAKECFITSNCTSINYRQNWKLCDLVMSNAIRNEIADDSTCIKSNITTWEKSLAGKCAGHNCEEGQKCELNADDTKYKCVKAYCKGLPNTPNAELQEPFGLRRDLDTGNKFKCGYGYKMAGKPFAVCKSPGKWTVLFNCTSAKECASNEILFDGETTTCIKLVSTRGTTWKNARKYCQEQEGGDLVSIISKAKWDFITKSFSNVRSVWIGLKDKTWMTGESFSNIYGVTIQLNNYDSGYPLQVNKNSCGILAPLSTVPLQDENCNIRERPSFLCEIIMSQN